MAHLASGFDDPAAMPANTRRLRSAPANVSARYSGTSAAGCLYDVVDERGGPTDPFVPTRFSRSACLIRCLRSDQALRVVDVVEWELLTPYGLRTLSPRDPNYRGRYEGDPRSRDGAYHQGTVWPWLLGPFLTAYVKVHGEARKKRAREPTVFSIRCGLISGKPAWARFRKCSMAMPRIGQAAASRRPGAWPKFYRTYMEDLFKEQTYISNFRFSTFVSFLVYRACKCPL